MSLDYVYLGETVLSKLSEEQWKLFDALIWATMAVDIGYVCEESAEAFVHRVNKQHLLTLDRDLTVDDVRPFFGLRTNVLTLPDEEWAKRHFWMYRWGSGGRVYPSDNAWAKKVDKLAYSPENEAKAEEMEKKAKLRKKAKEQ